MVEENKQTSRLVIIFFALVFLAIPSGCHGRADLLEPPLTLPLIRSSTPVNIQTNFRIKEAHLYALKVSFKCPEEDASECTRVRKLAVGDESSSTSPVLGSALSVDLLVERKEIDDSAVILKRSVDSERLKLSSWGWGSFDKELADFRLEPGSYKLTASVTKIDPTIKNVEIDLKLIRPYRGK